jgi:hypothetical protein
MLRPAEPSQRGGSAGLQELPGELEAAASRCASFQRGGPEQWLISSLIGSEVDRFLQLLGRSADSVDALVFPPKEGPGSDKGAHKLKLNEEGRQSVERLLSMPLYRRHALGIRPNPGGAKAAEITEGVALCSWRPMVASRLRLKRRCQSSSACQSPPSQPGAATDRSTFSGAPRREAPSRLRNGGRLKSGSSLPWKKWLQRLEWTTRSRMPLASCELPARSIPPLVSAAASIPKAAERYDLAALVELLPPLPEAPARKSSSLSAAKGDALEVAKALEALAFLPPLDFTSYDKWLSVGMALHSVSEELLPSWIDWSRVMGEVFDEGECCAKWQSFSGDREGGLGIGSLIHLAKGYGYRPPTPRQETPSSPPPLSWSELISSTLAAVRAGDEDAEMELRAEIAGRFRRNDSQVDAALFRLLTEQEAGPKKEADSADSVDLRKVQGLDYLVEGFLPANGLGLAYGSKGVGKTTAAVALGFSVVEGRGFLDHSKAAKKGRVLFIASDSGAGPLRSILQDMGLAEHPALGGPDQRFFVWAHEPDQGHRAWDVSVRGCVRLLQFVKEKGIDLVVADSAKAICAKAGISYMDNDSVNALLTFIKEAITPHTSVLFLSHDGTAAGSHAGAKAWAEIVDVVHRQTKPEGDHHSRQWSVVKNRLGPTREFSYALEEGELVLSHGVETIGDASSAVLKVLREAHANDKDRLSRKGIHEEVFRRFDYAPKTIDNTLQRLVQGKAPQVVRKGKGFYALSPKELYRGCLLEGEEWNQTSCAAMDLPITQALPEGVPVGNGGRSENWHALPEGEALGNGRVMASSESYQGKSPDSSPRGTSTPPENASVGLFESVEVLQGDRWCNGWVVSAEEGGELELFRLDDPSASLCLARSLVRPCQS